LPAVTLPLLLGHRGVRARGLHRVTGDVPEENSLQAFEYALSHGCDGFEFDVRHTRDGRNVLWHDPEWYGMEIAASDYADLAAKDGARLPLLEEVLRQFCRRAWLDVELKVAGGEESVIAALRSTPPGRGVIVSSFLPGVLDRMRELAPEQPLGFICDRNEALAFWREMPIQVLLPHFSLIRTDLIAEAHERGLQVMTWTVNDSRKMNELAAWGVDGLISDDPQLLYQTFHSD
jgi:glycerophosphoryl diester phosphodiesterase